MCKAEFSSVGFRTNGNNHWRVVNDVYQAFYLRRSSFGDSFTITFGILPLCQGLSRTDKNSPGLPYELGIFAGGMQWWKMPSDNSTEEEMFACVQELMAYLKKHLIPFFDMSKSCATAYESVVELEKHISHIQSTADVYACDRRKYYMLLKKGDYSTAIAILLSIRTQNMRALKQNISAFREIAITDAKEYNLQNYLQLAAFVSNKLDALDTLDREIIDIYDGNYFHINNELLANEQKSRIALGLEKPNEKG
jgi:hypothetical protein